MSRERERQTEHVVDPARPGPARPGPDRQLCPLSCSRLRENDPHVVSFLLSVFFSHLQGREHVNAFGQRQASKKRRKSRTAFTNHQIYELEKRFLYQKYLSPADRDQIAQQLGLSNAQVITWFQNRRAKLKRDLEEMKADVESLKKITPQTLQKLVSMENIEEQQGGGGEARSPSISPTSQGHRAFPQSPSSSRDQTTDEFSEDDEEIEVDDWQSGELSGFRKRRRRKNIKRGHFFLLPKLLHGYWHKGEYLHKKKKNISGKFFSPPHFFFFSPF